ncbi:MAG: MBL fold metallo-hydrolase [Eubacteriales bacterium]|nr:MBL fold metallo-hydrolase [Eubacteriales bacterium]
MITFQSQKISHAITRIIAPSEELIYLVEGSEKAALIDTGSGIGSLGRYVRSLTDKPLVVLLTHGHVDHAMGAGEFDFVYMNREDDYIYKSHADEKYRRDGLFLCTQADKMEEGDFLSPLPLECIRDMKEGDSFALGGITIEIYSCPGHTRGTLVMLIKEERVLLLGDACNDLTFMHEDYSTTIEEYEESLKRLKPLVEGKYDRVLLSHGSGDGALDLIDGVMEVCSDIINGNTDDVPFTFKDSEGFIAKAVDAMGARKDGEIGNIVFRKK